MTALFIAWPALCIAAYTDIRTGRIPNPVTLGGTAILVLTAVFQGCTIEVVTGIIAVALPLAVLHFGSRGEALGLGDVKLGALIGAALGWKTGIVAIAVAFTAGAVFGCIALAIGAVRPRQRIPFAPHLAIGSAIATAVMPYLQAVL